MTTSKKAKILEALGDKTNKVFFFAVRDHHFFEVYNINDVLIARFDRSDMDELIFNAKIITVEQTTDKQLKVLEDLKAKNKGSKPLFEIS